MNIFNYIKGNRKGKEANRFERNALKDPFLSDALEGFGKVDGDHLKAIKSLQKKVSGRAQRKSLYRWGWVAVIALLIAGGLVNHFVFTPEMTYKLSDITVTIEDIPVGEINADLQTSDSTPEKRELIAATPVIPPPPPVYLPDEIIVVEDTDFIVEESILQDAKSAELLEAMPASTSQVALQRNDVVFKVTEQPNEKVRDNTIIKGYVTDNSGEPLIGATVETKDHKKGTVTDMNGYFELLAAMEEVLDVNYIGYESLSIPIDSTTMLIAMHENDQILEEVTVVGFSNRSKPKIKVSDDSIRISTPKPVLGEKEFNKYLKRELIHPTDDECGKKKGKVQLIFSVNNEGRPYNIRIKKGVCPSIDREAIRLINEGPDWITGTKEAEVTVRF